MEKYIDFIKLFNQKPCNYTPNWKPSAENQHRKKKLPLLIAKAINSLPHKSFRFCSPMQNRWKLGHETI